MARHGAELQGAFNQWKHRVLFLDAIAKDSDLMELLEREVLPLYQHTREGAKLAPSSGAALSPIVARSFERGDWSDEALADAPESLHMLRDGIERFLARFRCMRVDWMRDVVLRTLTNLDNGRPPRRHVRGGDLRQLEAPYFFEVDEAPPFVFTRSGPVPRREETIEQRIARIRLGDVTDEERVALARLGPIEDQEDPQAIDEAELVEEARADAEEKDLAPCKCGRRPEYVEGEVKGASYGCYRCGRCEVEGTYTAGRGREAAARLYWNLAQRADQADAARVRKGLYWNVAQRARTEDKSRLNDLYHSPADPTSGPGWPSDVFEHPPWFPFWESADRYRREAEQAFKRQRQPIHGEITAFRRSLEAYLTLIRDRSQTLHPGEVEEALEMRADGARTDYNDDHARRRFERLALYCAGVETREIADREGITQRAVQKSNRELAELIGLGC